MAYRGRALVELVTELGEMPETPVEDIIKEDTYKIQVRVADIVIMIMIKIIIMIMAEMTVLYVAGYFIEERRRRTVIYCFPTRTIF